MTPLAGGRPLVVDDPASPTAEAFMELGACVVREVAKLQRLERNAVRSGVVRCPVLAQQLQLVLRAYLHLMPGRAYCLAGCIQC